MSNFENCHNADRSVTNQWSRINIKCHTLATYGIATMNETAYSM